MQTAGADGGAGLVIDALRSTTASGLLWLTTSLASPTHTVGNLTEYPLAVGESHAPR